MAQLCARVSPHQVAVARQQVQMKVHHGVRTMWWKQAALQYNPLALKTMEVPSPQITDILQPAY